MGAHGKQNDDWKAERERFKSRNTRLSIRLTVKGYMIVTNKGCKINGYQTNWML